MFPQGLERYNLTENPYANRELNPLKRQEDLERIARVDSFSLLEQVDVYLDARVQAGEPAFLVVNGRNGSGRSSVANYILARYRQLRGIDPQHFVVPNSGPLHDDPFGIYKNWALYLYDVLDEQNLELDDAVEQELITLPTAVDRETLPPRFMTLMRRVSRTLGAAMPPAGFGICLEDVTSLPIITTGKTIFQRAQTVCVFTTLSYESIMRATGNALAGGGRELPGFHLLGSREGSAGSVPAGGGRELPGELIDLNPLKGKDVEAVIRIRWNGTLPHPFDANGTGIEDAFPVARPIGQVLHAAATLLDDKVRTSPLGPPWPAAQELGFGHDDLVQEVPIALRSWRR